MTAAEIVQKMRCGAFLIHRKGTRTEAYSVEHLSSTISVSRRSTEAAVKRLRENHELVERIGWDSTVWSIRI